MKKSLSDLPPEERISCLLLSVFSVAGFVLSLIGFLLYILRPSSLSPAESAKLWHLPAEEYVKKVNPNTDAIWTMKLSDPYVLCIASLGILAAASFLTVTALSVLWFVRRNYVYSSMGLAAAGLLFLAILK